MTSSLSDYTCKTFFTVQTHALTQWRNLWQMCEIVEQNGCLCSSLTYKNLKRFPKRDFKNHTTFSMTNCAWISAICCQNLFYKAIIQSHPFQGSIATECKYYTCLLVLPSEIDTTPLVLSPAKSYILSKRTKSDQ